MFGLAFEIRPNRFQNSGQPFRRKDKRIGLNRKNYVYRQIMYKIKKVLKFQGLYIVDSTFCCNFVVWQGYCLY